MSPEEVHYRLMQILTRDPSMTQRELAKKMGVSVGKINYCLRALIEKGYIKIGAFHRSPDRSAHRYLLTPSGIQAKAWATAQFLRRKKEEYEAIRAEISALECELAKLDVLGIVLQTPFLNGYNDHSEH